MITPVFPSYQGDMDRIRLLGYSGFQTLRFLGD